MERPQGTSGNSKGKRFFDLLSGTPRVRIAPGATKTQELFASFCVFVIFSCLFANTAHPIQTANVANILVKEVCQINGFFRFSLML